MLSELRCLSGVPEVVSQLKQGAVYKLVAVPEGAKLYRDAAGNVKGVFYRDGKIVEHARFREIKPSLIKAAQSVGAQVLLVSIAMQLNSIEKSISRIITELHNDRVAEVGAGVRQFEEAMLINDGHRQSRMIEHAVQSFHVGYEKTLRALKMQIESAPDPKVGFFDNLLSDKSRKAREMMALAEESFKACILGLCTLAECYAFLGEHEAARFSFENRLDALRACPIAMASEKARLVEAENGRYAEEIWVRFLKNEAGLNKSFRAFTNVAEKRFEAIEIEFKPEELKGVRDDHL